MNARSLVRAAFLFAAAILLVACEPGAGGDDPDGYEVLYDGNGSTDGDCPVDGKLHSAGSDVAVLGAGDLVRKNFAFGGWNTEADGSGEDFDEGASFPMPAADLTLYARWTPMIEVVLMKQTAAPWGDDLMGSSETDTIAEAGALITSVAMMLSTDVPTIDPGVLNEYLTDNGGYVSEDLFLYNSVDSYPGSSYAFLETRSFSLADLKAELDLGNPVPVLVKSATHWALAVGYIERGSAYEDFVLADPGTEAYPWYLAESDTPSKLAIYHR